ncbi:MAG: toll/interleukin-1 receptor domain-containing protein [Hyphomicrobiales bacterium]
MAYLPEFRNEIFISYVHSPEEVEFRDSEDQGWTQLFAQYLAAKVNGRLVVRGDSAGVRIWTDTSLQGNRKLETALRSEVTESALFLPIMSPFYLSSDWCLQEAAWFIDAMSNMTALEQRTFIVKQYPTEEGEWPEAFTELKGYEFFKQVQRKKSRPLGSPLPNPRAEKHLDFFEMLDLLADDVADILRALKPDEIEEPEEETIAPHNLSSQGDPARLDADGSPVVYLARATEDVEDPCEELREALAGQNVFVVPASSFSSTGDIDADLKHFLPQSTAFVQILGNLRGSWDVDEGGFVQFQSNHASQTGKPVFQWWYPGTPLERVSNASYRAFLEGRTQLEHADVEAFLAHFMAGLEGAAGDDGATVFIDVTSDDKDFAERFVGPPVRKGGFEPILSMTEGSVAEMKDHREDHLRDSRGVVFVRREVDFGWLTKRVSELDRKIPKESRVAAIYLDDLYIPEMLGLSRDVIEGRFVFDGRERQTPASFANWVQSISEPSSDGG